MQQTLQTLQPNRSYQTKILFLSLYRRKWCNISATCEACNISRRTFYDWLEQDTYFATQIKEKEESIIDWAESMLVRNILAGKEKSLLFYLLNRRPDSWKDKSGQITVTQTNVNVNKLDPSQLDDKELDSVFRNIVANR